MCGSAPPTHTGTYLQCLVIWTLLVADLTAWITISSLLWHVDVSFQRKQHAYSSLLLLDGLLLMYIACRVILLWIVSVQFARKIGWAIFIFFVAFFFGWWWYF